MHLKHFIPNAFFHFFHYMYWCIKDQWLFSWLWWVIIRSRQRGWLEERRWTRNKYKKNNKAALHLTLLTWNVFPNLYLVMNLCSKYHFWLHVTKRNFGMQMERFKKCKAASLVSESPDAYASITLQLVWIS